jgi:iron complex outermembrane recepter protein
MHPHSAPIVRGVTRFAERAVHPPLVAAGLVAVLLAAGAPARADDPDLDRLSELSLEDLMEVQVTPFAVSTRGDQRYRASNSVSGSRIDTPIADLPFAVQAFTGAFIDDQRPETVFDVVRYSPGVTYRSNDFNEGNANVSIRGFAVGNKPGDTQLLRDGLRGPSLLDLTNVERVEVVKGPASFLYGQLAPGGVVNVITKDPQPRLQAQARAAYGSYGSYRLDADVTGPATPELWFRLASSYRQDLDYWHPYDAHTADVAPALAWHPNERMTLAVKYEGFRKREAPPLYQKPGYGTWGGVTPTPGDPNLSGVEVPGLAADWNSSSYRDFRNSDTDSVELVLDARLTDHWDARVRAGWQAYRVDALFSGNLGIANGTFLQGRRFRRQTYANEDQTVEAEAVGRYRLELPGLGEVGLRALLGAQLVEGRFHRTAAQAPNDPAYSPPSPLPPWDLRDPSTWDRTVDIPLSALTASTFEELTLEQDRAVYGGLTAGLLGDRLLLLAGVRYTATEIRFSQGEAVTVPGAHAGRFTPQYGALVKPAAGLSLFASWSTSFVPNPQPLFLHSVNHGFAVPTEGQGVDLGAKADLLSGRLSGTVTFFRITNRHILTDIAELDPVSGDIEHTIIQSGRQRSTGVELDATLTPADSWQVVLTYSYMDARIEEVTGHDRQILAQDPSALDAAGQANYKQVLRYHGAPLQMSAPHLASLWTRWNVPTGILAGLYLAGGANLVHDQTLLSDTPRSHHQSYVLFQALAGYRWTWAGHPASFDVVGKNLTDRYYRPSQSTRPRPRELASALTLRL